MSPFFEQAMDIEKEAESLYRQFSLEAPSQGMKAIFTWLADKEEEHYEIFEKMKEGIPVTVPGGPVLRGPQEIVADWKDGTVFLGSKVLQLNLYQRALSAEIKSVSAYQEYAHSAPSSQKKAFLRISAEEEGHRHILETMIEFIINHEEWVENAAFSRVGRGYHF